MATINDIQNSLAQIGNDLGADINGLLDARDKLVAHIRKIADDEIQSLTSMIAAKQDARDEQVRYVSETINYQATAIASRIDRSQNEKAAA